MTALFAFIFGLGSLIVGAELLVRGAANVAVMLRVTPMVIGLTIVAIGTSTPELAVGITAGVHDAGGLAVGNVAGANVFVLLVVMGISAMIRPLPLDQGVFKLQLPMIVLAAGLMTVLALDGVLSRLDGLIMFLVGVGYTIVMLFFTRRAPLEERKEFSEEYGPQTVPHMRPVWMGRAWYTGMLIVGIALTVLGAEMLVRGATAMATALGVSPTVIGLTIVAFGTSSPELFTTIVLTLKDDRDVAIGNLIGSAIYNILCILSIVCMVTPGGLSIEPHLLYFDIPLMAGVAIGAIPVFITGRQVSRLEGGLGIAIYICYLAWLMYSGG